MKLILDGQPLDLKADFSMEVEDTNPVYNDRGSQTVSATVPATGLNSRLLAFPHRPDTGTHPNLPERRVTVADGAYVRSGLMNVTDASPREGVTFNIGFDNSRLYASWQGHKLGELRGLPVHVPAEPGGGGYPIDWLLEELLRVYKTPRPREDDFAVFPLAIGKASAGSDDDAADYWEILNLTGERGLEQPVSVKRLIDGTPTDVSVPAGYCVSPFLRVWRVLELVFADADLTMDTNPFRESAELCRLVVLNNAADAVCTGAVRYADLMPDCTVAEFLNALRVRFGMVYNANFDTGRVEVRFLRDILHEEADMRLDPLISDYRVTNYRARGYVTLSAQTGIEGAEPASERFEEFSKGLDISYIALGSTVNSWKNSGTAENPRWDGDVRDDWPDYYEPDPDEGPDEGYYAMPAKRAVEPQKFLAREFVTGTWYLMDALNGRTKATSSSFFNWDPAPEGLEATDLSSADECVPVARVRNTGTGTGHTFNDYCPLYLFGSRHYHSYIKGNDDNEADEGTPLAFAFAYETGGRTVGRMTPEGDDGLPMVLDDGTRPALSLLFQFRDGLFATFWREYDEILRHGNRLIEVTARIPKHMLPQLDMLRPVTFRGVRCLIDKVTYSLPAPAMAEVELELRTIQTQGTYDIDSEQGIPAFSSAARHLLWKVEADAFGAALNTTELRDAAQKQFRAATGYKDHGEAGDFYSVDASSLVMFACRREALTWENDPLLVPPGSAGVRLTRYYKALLTYDVYELHDTRLGPDDTEGVEMGREPIGRVTIEAEYSVSLVSAWAYD